MGMWFSLYLVSVVVLLIVLGTSTDYFWRRCQRLEREVAKLRDRALAAEAKSTEWAALVALVHEANYRLACDLYGRGTVDHAIAQAHKRGVS